MPEFRRHLPRPAVIKFAETVKRTAEGEHWARKRRRKDLRLTQAEAGRSEPLSDVRRYDIEVDLTDLLDGTDFRCVSTIRFTCRSPGARRSSTLPPTVVSATLNGAALPPAEAGADRADRPGGRERARRRDRAADTTDGEGVHRAVDPADKEVYVWTSFEPDEARRVWACFDQPDLKAPHPSP